MLTVLPLTVTVTPARGEPSDELVTLPVRVRLWENTFSATQSSSNRKELAFLIQSNFVFFQLCDVNTIAVVNDNTTSETDATSTGDINSSWKNEDWSWILKY